MFFENTQTTLFFLADSMRKNVVMQEVQSSVFNFHQHMDVDLTVDKREQLKKKKKKNLQGV